jgi:hypothetical protein
VHLDGRALFSNLLTAIIGDKERIHIERTVARVLFVEMDDEVRPTLTPARSSTTAWNVRSEMWSRSSPSSFFEFVPLIS